MMNLHLPDISSLPKVITCTIEGILEPDDVSALLRGEVQGLPVAAEAGPPPPVVEDNPLDLKRIREKHHSVARLIAQGMTQRLTASITGYTEQYISILLNNPAMEELVAMYRARHSTAAEVLGEKLRIAGGMAVDKLVEKMGAEMVNDVHELTAIAKLGLDRSGHGPTSTHNVKQETHVIDHAKIAELNAAAKRGSSEYIVPVRNVRAALTHNPAAAEDTTNAGE